MTNILHKLLDLTKNNKSEEAKSYLTARDISSETSQKWEIGFLSDQKQLETLDSDLDVLYDTKLLVRKIHYSPLHQYITFPMYDQYNKLIGFSGRPPLSNEEVKIRNLKKYWHSVFEKRRFLFGLNFALQSIREKGYAIVGEGQFDTITAHQAGIQNVVSTCGTALTSFHVALLARYADTVYVVFDNDEHGIKAFDKLQKYAKQGISLIPCILPSQDNCKEDIDSFIRKYGAAHFLEIVMSCKSSAPHTMDLS